MGILAKPLGYLLTWLYNVIGSYGLALVVLTLIVKICLYPLYANQIKTTTNMTKLQPKIREIQQKYAHNKELMNEKMADLYQQEGGSMYGGCMPMLVQMFVIMGLFGLLRNPMAYINDNDMLFAIHESFLWINDLAQPDKWILPIVSGIATFIAFNFSQTSSSAAGPNADQANMMMKIMKYFFPLMILMMARSYPAGLAIYWSVSQIVQIFYNIRFARLKKEILGETKKKSKRA